MSPESGPCSSVCWDRQGWDLVGSVVIVQMDLCSARKVGALLLAVKRRALMSIDTAFRQLRDANPVPDPALLRE